MISKTFDILFDPVFHWTILLVMSFVLIWLRPKLARWILSSLTIYFLLVVATPLPVWLIRSLESQYPSVDEIEPGVVVVVLTGGTVRYDRQEKKYLWLEGADRFLEPLRSLLRNQNAESRNPNILIVSGKEPVGMLGQRFTSEVESMNSFAQEMGWPENQLIVEDQARNTWENASQVAQILAKQKITDFYLVTSAYHMPRSMQSFRNFKLVPKAFPVDRQITFSSGFSFGFENLRIFRLALHEYIGMTYYWFLSF